MRLVTLIVGLLLTAPAYADDADLSTITVNGQFEQEFTPDQAEVTVVLEGRGKDVATAKKQHDERLTAMMAVAKEFDIPEKEIKTLSDRINPEYDYPANEGQKLREYVAQHRIEVTLPDTKRVGMFVNALVAKNIDQVESVAYSLRDDTEAQRQTLTAAIKDARAKAEVLAQASGVSLGAVHRIDASTGVSRPQPMAMMAMRKSDMMESPAAPPIPEGDVTISQNVQASYLIAK